MKCQHPHVVGHPSRHESWLMLDSCKAPATSMMTIQVQQSVGQSFRSRYLRDTTIEVGVCGRHRLYAPNIQLRAIR